MGVYMKILLAVPPRARKSIFHIIPPLGLGYLSAALKREGMEVELLNSIKDGLDQDRFIDRAGEMEPDVVGYQVFTSDVKPVRELSARIKSIHPRVVQVVGGYHPSAVPERSMEIDFPDVDFAFAGEAETGFPILLKKLERGEGGFEDVPGLVWRRDGGVVVNAPHFVQDLDRLGMPDWELINPLEYQKTLTTIMIKAVPFAPILASRGCPYRCTFCSAHRVSGRRVRVRSAENVVAELDYLHNRFRIKEFQVQDDNFTWDRDFVMKFCDLLTSEGRKYYWSFPNGMRLNTLDRELLSRMKEAGCYSINIGIESGSDRVLKMIKKSLKVSEIREKIRLIREAGLPVTASFVIGFPGETLEDIRKTEELILSEDFFAAHIFMFHPLPGTEAFDQLVESGEIDEDYLGFDADHSSFADAVYSPKGITREELKKIHRRINRAFYLRPGRMLKILVKIKARTLFYFFKRAFSYLF